MSIDLNTVELAYMECALWSSTDENDEPLDRNHSLADLAPETRAAMRAAVESFVTDNLRLLEESKLTSCQIGHDFWLTRNRHGAGFWDRGLGPIGEELTKATRFFPEVNLYVGDDGRIYQ